MLLLIALWLHVLQGVVQAFPMESDGNSTAILQRRQCEWNAAQSKYVCDDKLPTVDQIIARMRNVNLKGRVTKDRFAVFYTNLDDKKILEEKYAESMPYGWLKSRDMLNDFYWVFDALDVAWLKAQLARIDERKDVFEAKYGPDPAQTFISCFYEALATAAINPTVLLFTPKNTEWKADSAWALMEFPPLTQNPNVARIYRVDPRPPSVKGITDEENCGQDEMELLWDRKRGDNLINQRFKCPIR